MSDLLSHSLFQLWFLRNSILAPAAVAAIVGIAGCTEEVPADPSAKTSDSAASASAAPEGTDVWLLDLRQEGEVLRAASPRNLTNRPGYDNQPFFTPAGDILFVQMEDGRTDLWRWSAQTERSTPVTSTPLQGEFSPTPIPGSKGGISYIRSPDDTSGRLWRMPNAGAEPEIVFADIGPVGYHAWFDADHVALWRLQDPSLLQLVDLATQETRTLATGVGRTPQSIPDRRAVSFTRMTEEGRVLEAFDLDLDRTETVAILPEGGDFHTWTPTGVLLCTAGSQVFALVDGEWQEVVDLSDRGLTVSRLNVSPDGKRLALVAEPME